MAHNEINDVGPSSISHLVGQSSVKQQVAVALEAAWADNRKMDHCLMVGGPGLGKSQLANVIAKEMASGFHEVLGQSLRGAGDINALLLAAKDKDCIHIDEIHELDPKLQTALYLALDKRTIFVPGSKSVQSIPLADFTLLASTTDEYRVLAPLRDRMRLVLRLVYYSTEELALLTFQRSHALGWDTHEDLLPQIAQRSRGTPRLALRLLQSCRRVCRADGRWTIGKGDFVRACQLEDIDSLGLGVVEQQYLALLVDGPSRLNVLASSIGLPTRTISNVIEPFLIRAGLIGKDNNGCRQLTTKGHEHLRGEEHDG